jgi:hypothetical protein
MGGSAGDTTAVCAEFAKLDKPELDAIVYRHRHLFDDRHQFDR